MHKSVVTRSLATGMKSGDIKWLILVEKLSDNPKQPVSLSSINEHGRTCSDMIVVAPGVPIYYEADIVSGKQKSMAGKCLTSRYDAVYYHDWNSHENNGSTNVTDQLGDQEAMPGRWAYKLFELQDQELCDHEDTWMNSRTFDHNTYCLDCGKDLDEDGPLDDDWIQSSLERSAGVGEPDRRYYDGGRLIDPDKRH